MASSGMDSSECVEKSLLVRNLGSLGSSLQMSDVEIRDKLTIHFQNRKFNHGGDIKKVIYPLNFDTDCAIVVFDDVIDRESAFQHEQVFYSQQLTVSRLPPIFTSITAEIDPVYFNIMPLNMAGEFATRIQKMVTVDKANCSKISCSYPAQLERVEKEVIDLVMSHGGTSPPTSMISDDDDVDEFGTAGASSYDNQPPNPLQRSQEGFGDNVGLRCHEAAAEGGTDRSYRDAPLEETEEPEKFHGTHFGDQMQHTTHSNQNDGSAMNYSSSVVQGGQTSGKVDDDNNGDALQNDQDTGVVLNKYIYRYLEKIEGKALRGIFHRCKLKFASIPEKTGGEVKAHVVGSGSKATAENITKARDEFISFYQKAHGNISRKTIDCSGLNRRDFDHAVKQTQRDYKVDTLITQVDGPPGICLIIRKGDVDEVARKFREIAGINSGRKLRAPSSPGKEGAKIMPMTELQMSTRQNASNRTRDALPTREPEHSSPTLYSTVGVSQNSHETSADSPLIFTTNEGINITILQGDITKQDVQAVVNPTDSFLSNSGGVAKAIHLAAGSQLRRECENFFSRFGSQHLQVSQCVITSGFNLKCSIIHVVVPTASHNFGWNLYKTFLNCLHTAKNYEVPSVAIPLMGSGTIGAPKNVCADALKSALLDFSKVSPAGKTVREVILVNIDKESTVAIQQSLQAAFNEPSNAAFAARHLSEGGGAPGTGLSHPALVDLMKPGSSHQPPQRPSGNQHSSAEIEDGKVFAEQLNKDQQGSTGGNTSSGAYGNAPVTQVSKTAVNTAKPTGAQLDPLGAKAQGSTTGDKTDKCPICLSDTIKDEVVLDKCKHRFCKDCIKKALENHYTCPVCNVVCRQPRGNQPDGKMTDSAGRYSHLPGYPKDGVITIRYDIPRGTQTADHPNPGMPFSGCSRTAYLPDNQEGREVLRLLRKAFDAGLVFTVGTSVTSGLMNTVTWNDIHHKTSMTGGPSNYGYPDPDYLKRVKADLAAKGIV